MISWQTYKTLTRIIFKFVLPVGSEVWNEIRLPHYENLLALYTTEMKLFVGTGKLILDTSRQSQTIVLLETSLQFRFLSSHIL